eukprot:scaffold19873_cov68-Phaeocystis_antarctica.AAC.1
MERGWGMQSDALGPSGVYESRVSAQGWLRVHTHPRTCDVRIPGPLRERGFERPTATPSRERADTRHTHGTALLRHEVDNTEPITQSPGGSRPKESAGLYIADLNLARGCRVRV